MNFPPPKERVYALEFIELKGTNRIDAAQVAEALNLKLGAPLTDEFVLSAKARLLSLGLFQSVILVMKKGSEKGKAKLVIEVEDDDDVLSDWAIGGTLGVTQSENQVTSGDFESAPLGYHLNLVSRNLFNQLHRSSLLLDVDGEGSLKKGIFGYGLPKFTEEGVQFDTEFGVIDTNLRYIDAMGFGGWGQGMWTTGIGEYGHVTYGAAMFVNTGKNYRVPGFPNSVAGPKVGFFRETRLRSFIPSSGYHLGVSLLVAPVKTEHSLFEATTAGTINLFTDNRVTIEAKSRFIGDVGYSLRGGIRFDIPFSLSSSNSSQGSSFIHLRSGIDHTEEADLFGSSAIFGLRYHSSGFIAEFAFKVTKLPKPLEKVKEETK